MAKLYNSTQYNLTNKLVAKLSRLRLRTIAQDKPLDIGLVTRLQNRVKELEREKKLLQREVDLRDDLHGVSDRFGGQSLVDTEREIYETIKVRLRIIIWFAFIIVNTNSRVKDE